MSTRVEALGMRLRLTEEGVKCIECLNPQVPRIRRGNFDHPTWGIARSNTLSRNSNFDWSLRRDGIN